MVAAPRPPSRRFHPIEDSRLCFVRSDAVEEEGTNVPQDGAPLITKKPTGFYSGSLSLGLPKIPCTKIRSGYATK